MRKKLSLEEFERLIEAWGVLERLSRIDLGTYYPIVTAGGENPFALALGSPGSPVSARLETPEGPVDLTVSWNPKVEKPRDLMAEQARRRSSSGSLAASGKKPDSEKKKPEKSDRPEDQDDLDFKPSELDSKGAFELTVQNAPEGFELQDIRFEREGRDDQPIIPVMRTGEVVIPDSDCDGAIESMVSKVYGRVTHRGPSRAPHKQASTDEDSRESHTGLINPVDLTLTYKGFELAYRRDSGWVYRICRNASLRHKLHIDDVEQSCDVSQLVWLRISRKPIDGFPFKHISLGKDDDPSNLPLDSIQLAPAAIYKLASGKAIDLRRKERDHFSLDAQIDSNDSASRTLAEFVEDYKSTALRGALVETDQLERLRSAIKKLPQEQFDLIFATRVEGRSQKHFAESKELTVQAVKNRVLRVLEKLRLLLKSEPE